MLNLTCDKNEGVVTGAGNYMKDKEISIEVKPKTGYTFAAWYESGKQVSANNPYSFTATANRNLLAKFEKNIYTVSVNIEGGGTVSGTSKYSTGSTVTLEAKAASNYIFSGFYNESNTLISSSAKYTFKIEKDTKLTVKFSANNGNGGTINGTPKEIRVITLVNQERAKVGLPALKAHNSLMESAKEVKENQMINNKRPDGSSYSTAILIPVIGSGENLILDPTPENAVARWMVSSGHKANILNKNWTHIGVGSHKFIPILGGYVWVQIFARID